MQTLIFSNETALQVAAVNGQSTYTQGVQRDSLEIQVPKANISFDALDVLTASKANTDRLTLVTPDGDKQTQAILDHYVIRAKLELRPIDIMSANGTPTGTTEERYCVTLAQLTYKEQQDAQRDTLIADMQQAIAALAFGGEA